MMRFQIFTQEMIYLLSKQARLLSKQRSASVQTDAGNSVGNATGNLVGNAVGNAAGNLAGYSAGNLVGNVAGNAVVQDGGHKAYLRKAVIGGNLAFGIG